MALAAGTVWEVRSTGSDNNGGGYAGGGTDYTMQDGPRATLTAASVVHTSTSQINVAVGDYTVGAGDVGNIVQVTGGTATPAFYYISVVDIPNNRWTVDKPVGTAGQTVVGAMGGALASPGKCGSVFLVGNTMWVKAATYSITSATANIAGGCVSLTVASGNLSSRISGYGTTRGDGGRPTLQASGAIATFVLVTTGGGNTADSLILDGALKTSSRAMTATNGRVIRCKAVNCTNFGIGGGAQTECEASGCSGSNTFGLTPQTGFGCWSHDNVSNCGGFAGSATNTVMIDCIASNNAGAGFADLALPCRFWNCTSYGNTGNGFTGTVTTGLATSDWLNCIAYGNTGAGIATGANASVAVHLAFLGANGGGATTGSGRILTTVTLTADPFVNAAANNFALNNTAGGGALVRAAAIPAAFPGGFTTSFLDGGAVQTAAGVSPTFPPANQVYAGVDRGDGTIGTLHASTIAAAAGAGVNLTPTILLTGNTVDDVVGSHTEPVVTFPPASKVYSGTNRGDGVTGTLHASNIATAAGSGVNLTPTILLAGNVVDDVTGTHTEAPAPTFPPASKVYAGTDRGDGTIGTLHASTIAAAAGAGSNLTPTILLIGNVVDDVTGTHTEAAAPTYPPANKVYFGTNRGDGVTGTLHASNIATAAGSGENLLPAVLLSGHTVDDVIGAVVLPSPTKVYSGTNRGDGTLGLLHASNIAVAAGAGVSLAPGILEVGQTVDDVMGTLAPPPPPTFPPASKVYAGTDRGDGVLGTLHASTIAVAAGSGGNLIPSILLGGHTVDDVEGAVTLPSPINVYGGVDRGDGIPGVLHASNIAVAAGGGVSLAPGILRIGHTVDDVVGAQTDPVIDYPPASRVYAGEDRGDGVLGTLHASTIAEAAGAGVDLTPALLKAGVVVDDVTGVYSPPAATEVFRATLRRC